ncbi:acetate--CoA ligase [Paenibacillus crassostreae]|uniref:acetate--CoA ligase n=1 Tax=Paenibacillus crassostreae TaxID=1763538 RepID=A0A162RL34_9BACL|nr:acetate--CoA ligase [Paenibacillus crassostreae]AOZ91559.1 acetate--CoA ligase [Paenibacillus crassostreae]OAB72867.1 acetyl-CoA synthetase [Paenibacillus crassostreae]
MEINHSEIFPSICSVSNMGDYEQACEHFNWEDIERHFTWYETGKCNMAYEVIDRHVTEGRGEKVALLYSDPLREETFTFRQLRDRSNQFGNVLRKYGLSKGDRVFIFMPRSPELYICLLGILKIGAVVGPLFEAFMETAVKERLIDSGAVALITTSSLLGRVTRSELPDLKHVFLVGDTVEQQDSVIHYHDEMASASSDLELEWLDRDDGLIMHYTSGSTGKPKGVYHVQNAMIQQYYSAQIVLDLREDDIYWCTADPGWVTGTAYGIFAPWLSGVTNVVRGGRFSPQDWYATIDKYKVTVWYSAPTAYRMLMGAGEEILTNYKLSSLRHVLSVGEPLNPEVVRWGYKVYGQRIHDTWWMTETGAQMICNYPGMPIKPGSMGRPLPGIEATIKDDKGNTLPPYTMGNLAIKVGWPAMMNRIWNNKAKYEEYFRVPGWYISGDSAYMDDEGYFWFQGRVDDVINSSGERIGPFEVESKLLEHPAILEAGVIGKPDVIRGEIIKAFISLREGYEATPELKEEIVRFVKEGLSAHAAPREIEFKEKLPKTRSGKIMRRVLKAWELDLPTGDLSTIDD